MRSIVNVTIRFGKVAIPVGLTPTVQSDGLSFKTLHRPCGNPTQMNRVCPEHGPIPDVELVKGFEVAKGQYVLVEDDELAALAPNGDRSLDVVACVSPTELNPLAVEKRYYLSPSESPLGRRPYLLLRQALADTGTVALTRFVAFGSEWLAAIRPLSDRPTLLLEKLSFQEDLVGDREIVEQFAGAVAPTDEETRLGAALAEQLRPFRLRKSLLTSEHRQRVRQLLEAKLAGEDLVQPATPIAEDGAQIRLPVDLTDALQRSLKKPPRDRSAKPRRRVTAKT